MHIYSNIVHMINTTGLLQTQIPHVKTLVDSIFMNGFAADLSETGCGKTYCAVAAAREINVPVFVICPKIIIPSWKKVFKEFGIKPLAVRNYESLIRGNKRSYYTSWVKEDHPYKKDTYGNPIKVDRLRFNNRLPKNALIIYDEVHKCKALDSTNSELLMTAREQGFKTLMVSASAATNPVEMRAFGYNTHLHNHYCYNEFKRVFAINHGAEWRKEYGGMVFNPTSEKCQQAMKDIHHYLFNKVKCASRLTTKQMAEHFGENHVTADALDTGNTDKINRVYDQMEYELAMLDEKSSGYSDHIFAIMMRARRMSELLKIPCYVEQTIEKVQEGKSVAVFLNFNESIDSAIKRLEKKFNTKKHREQYGNIEIVTIRGGQSAKARQQAIEAFQNDKARVIICNIAAGGVGVSLHDLNGNFPRHSIISPNYSPVQLIQSLGRIYRAEGKTPAIQNIIYAAGTIEEKACAKVQAKLDNLSLLNSGDTTAGIKFFSGNHTYVNWDNKAA